VRIDGVEVTQAPFPVGSRVRLTGVFLRSTGQIAGPEGAATWTTVACECRNCTIGDTTAVNEPSYYDDTHPRHIATINLFRVGTMTVRNCP